MSTNHPHEYRLWKEFYCCLSKLGQKSSEAILLAESVNANLRTKFATSTHSDVINDTMDKLQAANEAKTIKEIHDDGHAYGEVRTSYDFLARESAYAPVIESAPEMKMMWSFSR